eukprot:TRINITY_DN1481_c0_g1_i1.p1 TRINITY_DN1481_c0_g1~~TRINITY_DN1481_c0_g1_i1.p1  ORF type:complete len:284 (+),score=55.04 TRINITY_DN1481_c0_g1_i1:113-964(+)
MASSMRQTSSRFQNSIFHKKESNVGYAYNPTESLIKTRSPRVAKSTSSRFAASKTISPGPGSYNPPSPTFKLKGSSSEVRLNSSRLSASGELRRSQLGTEGGRTNWMAKIESPGPGAYTQSHMALSQSGSMPKLNLSPRKSSSFGSSDRFAKVETITPGPGAYRESPRRKIKGALANSQSRELKFPGTAIDPAPGPGNYNQDYGSILNESMRKSSIRTPTKNSASYMSASVYGSPSGRPLSSSGFGSSPRFQSLKPSTSSDVGPGAYDDTRLQRYSDSTRLAC